MALKEKRHLYYGYTFNENYSPYSHSDDVDSLRTISQKEDLNLIDFLQILEFGDSALASNPFDLRTINYQLYALEELANESLFNIKVTQLRIVFDALVSSGNVTRLKRMPFM